MVYEITDITGIVTTDVVVFGTSFLFVFAIIFGLLVYIKIFEKSRGAIAAIAAVIAFSSAIYWPIAVMIYTILPFASIILVILFFIVFIKKVFRPEEKERGKPFDPWPLVISLVIFLLLIGIFWENIATFFNISESMNILWLIGIFVIILIFYLFYRATAVAPPPAPAQRPGI